jgi:hypothetical protein
MHLVVLMEAAVTGSQKLKKTYHENKNTETAMIERFSAA